MSNIPSPILQTTPINLSSCNYILCPTLKMVCFFRPTIYLISNIYHYNNSYIKKKWLKWIILADNQSRLCSAGVLAAAISKSESQEEMIDDLLEGDVVGKIETIAIIIKLKPELLMSNQKLATLLAGKISWFTF